MPAQPGMGGGGGGGGGGSGTPGTGGDGGVRADGSPAGAAPYCTTGKKKSAGSNGGS